MKLLYELPDNVLREVKRRAGDDEILCCVPFDLDNYGMNTDGWFTFTKSRILYTVDGIVKDEYEIGSDMEFRAESLVGCGILEMKKDNVSRIIARFTMKHVPRYTAIAGILNEISSGVESEIYNEDEKDICPKCGKVMGEGTGICRFCTGKTAVLRGLWKQLRSFRFKIILVLSLSVIINVVNVLIPFLYRILIDDYLIPLKKEILPMLMYVGAIAAGSFINMIIDVIKGRIILKVGTGISKDLRSKVFTKVQALSVSNLNRRKTGDLMNRVTGDTNTIQLFYQHNFIGLLNQVIILIGVQIVLFCSNWKLALLVIAPIAPVVILCKLIWHMIFTRYKKQNRIWDKANSLLQDILSGIKVVKVFGQEKKETKRFRDISRLFADTTKRNEKTWNTLFPTLGFIVSTGYFFVLYFGSELVLHQELKVGELVQFTNYAMMIYGPLTWLVFVPRMFAESTAAAGRILDVIDEEPDVKDSDNARVITIKGDVTLKDVSFGYKSYDPVLKNIDLHVTAGETIGIVGLSGTGKSTLINMIMRFYDVDRGQILLDGIDIKDISLGSLRSQVGAVLQETFLFSGTILDNIRYAKPDAELDEVIRAAKIANAHNFIVSFPDGYETRIGEHGQTLSGGERQRLAIARAILCDPKILILDEATASMDTETEQQIQEALNRLVKNRTTFAIAHRLSTLRNADRLIVLDDGKLAEHGTHEELLKRKGIYYRLVMAQRQMTQIRAV